ncbi:uncharacterized protein LOC106163572 isoform X2 [Lingula anatina]|nr:uncharacterized protein LOC106163572 isoform X2 [Lingula anatina]XP_013396660.1 uncharacterized protein LOC106163572 isoform X2 [Lingula anatina]XP_013396661.1 uncharacterized protein LOC106163572 isoform X2 [Lingula anatina]XP_013396662.1 uncharacterized protein LOC106163572 isoform X2 [Lingula anatina]|eukprot:XP_013396659.1 uncharacterized protein LOC106163572 isoform X2 [Lingula anatina]
MEDDTKAELDYSAAKSQLDVLSISDIDLIIRCDKLSEVCKDLASVHRRRNLEKQLPGNTSTPDVAQEPSPVRQCRDNATVETVLGSTQSDLGGDPNEGLELNCDGDKIDMKDFTLKYLSPSHSRHKNHGISDDNSLGSEHDASLELLNHYHANISTSLCEDNNSFNFSSSDSGIDSFIEEG